MLFLDVDICIHGIHPEASAEASSVREWLIDALNAEEAVGVSEYVLSSMIRIATHGVVFDNPSTPHQAVEFSNVLLAAPAAVTVRPGPHHWSIFTALVEEQRLRAKQIPDAYLAALAMERGATFVTLDHGFARFDGLRVLNPLAS